MKNRLTLIDTQLDPDDSSNEKSVNAATIEGELADIFDRYATAMDSGDRQSANAILDKYPSIGDEFRAPLHGLYMLGRASQQKHFDSLHEVPLGRSRLGDYEIEGEIGRGGMGVVYAATQISLRRRVALKVLPFMAVLDPRQVARFRNEAQAAASLVHPNIVPVYAVGCERGVHYYSMQLIEGQSLEQFVEELRQSSNKAPAAIASNPTQACDASTVVSIASRNYVHSIIETGIQVACAIEFAHQHGIVHRDIKPSNLMLDQSGSVWITDFGLARCQGASNLTSQGDRIGTARYMSPEQAVGRAQQIDFRTDIYSLGVTLYELLTLRPAFDMADRMQLLAAIESSEPVPLRKLNSTIPLDLETVIGKAMAKTPADRYHSSQAFADDLLRCLDGQPVLARRQTLLDRGAKSIAKHKWLVAGLGIACLSVAIISLVLATVFYQQRQRELASAEQARFYLQQAHQAVNRFGGLLSDELEKIPGTESIRARLLGEAVGYYGDFLKFAADSQQLKIEQALAHSQLAGLHERAGDDDLALQNYETAIGQLAQLNESSATSADVGFEMAICHNKLGLLHKRHGQYERSRQELESALAQFDLLDSAMRRRLDVLAACAHTRANLGMLKRLQGDLSGAAIQLKLALAQLSLPGAPPLNDVNLRSAYLKISGTYVAVLTESNPDLAESTLLQSITELEDANSNIRSDQTSAKPNSSAEASENRKLVGADLLNENLAHLADMQNNLAILLCHKNQLQQAEHFGSSATNYWRSQYESFPDDLNAAESLATALNTLGEISLQSNDGNAGDNSFADAESLLRRVVEHHPNRPEPLSRLAGVLHNRSLVAFSNRDVDRATQMVRLAIDFQSKALNLAPDNSQYQTFLNSHQQTLGTYLTAAQPKLFDKKNLSENVILSTSEINDLSKNK